MKVTKAGVKILKEVIKHEKIELMPTWPSKEIGGTTLTPYYPPPIQDPVPGNFPWTYTYGPTNTTAIIGKADLSNLRQTAGIPPVSGRRHSPDVLNGIAYDAKNNRIFITGKNWNKLFEIKLDN